MLLGPLEVNINFQFKSKVHADLFNLPKGFCDAFNGVIWKDDRQIKRGRLQVAYGDFEEIYLEVIELDDFI